MAAAESLCRSHAASGRKAAPTIGTPRSTPGRRVSSARGAADGPSHAPHWGEPAAGHAVGPMPARAPPRLDVAEPLGITEPRSRHALFRRAATMLPATFCSSAIAALMTCGGTPRSQTRPSPKSFHSASADNLGPSGTSPHRCGRMSKRSAPGVAPAPGWVAM